MSSEELLNLYFSHYQPSPLVKTHLKLTFTIPKLIPDVTLSNIRLKGIIVSFLSVILIAVLTCFALETCLVVKPIFTAANQSVNKPFIIDFSGALRKIDTQHIQISPKIEGVWTFKSGQLIHHDQLIFTPKNTFKTGTTYTITPIDTEQLLLGSAKMEKIVFKTKVAPGLANTGINNIKDGYTVAADYDFSVSLTTTNEKSRKLELQTTPAIVMTKSIVGDKQFIWHSATPLPQGQSVILRVYDSQNDVVLMTKTIQITAEPAVQAFSKKDHFNDGDKAIITFNEPIEPTGSKNISFNIEGKGSWQSDTVYTFTPQKVTPGQTYTYTISKGLRSKNGGILTKGILGNFTTTGAVTVIGSSPHGNDMPQGSQQVGFSFDQPVDHSSVERLFSVSAGQVTGTSWRGNTFTATVINLGYQQTITARVAIGVQNAGFGLPSAQSFSNTFNTEVRSVRLDVPYFHQQFVASCAAASLRMILAFHGVSTDDMSIIYKMGYNPSPENKTTDPYTWDDPQVMFVGDVNGSIRAGTAAGPDAQPVAKAAESYGLSASAVTGIGINWVSQQLYNGDPVVIFGATSTKPTAFITWKTPSGRIESMNPSGHARTVIGVVGESSNPIGFWVSDPLSGTSYWSADALAANIRLDAYQQAIVVY